MRLRHIYDLSRHWNTLISAYLVEIKSVHDINSNIIISFTEHFWPTQWCGYILSCFNIETLPIYAFDFERGCSSWIKGPAHFVPSCKARWHNNTPFGTIPRIQQSRDPPTVVYRVFLKGRYPSQGMVVKAWVASLSHDLRSRALRYTCVFHVAHCILAGKQTLSSHPTR